MHSVLLPRISLIIVLLLSNSCTRLFFVPLRPLLPKEQVEKSLGVKIEEKILRDEGEPNLHGASFMASSQETKKAIILFLHGNAGNISTQIFGVGWLLQYDLELFLFDYRGYGNSQGEVEIEGAHRDVCRMIRFAELQSLQENLPLFVIGESLGASFLITSLAKFQNCGTPQGVVIISPFLSYPEVARDTLRPLGVFRYPLYPLSWFVRADYDPKKFLNDYPDIPTLILHGEKDQIVPYSHGKRLFDMLPRQNVRGCRFPARGHNELLGDGRARGVILGFVGGGTGGPAVIE